MTMTANFLRAALKLADRGLHVFPCKPRDKRPATLHGVKDATIDPDVIERWWRQEPSFNIGVATGTTSGIMVIDVDNIDAEAELKKLETANGALPATVESITARGRHLYFRWPEGGVRNSAGKIAPGIDVRASGGYIVAPPSLHPSGKRYCWSVDSASAFAPAPEWLIGMVTAPAAMLLFDNTARPADPAQWRDLVRNGITEGCRNDKMARLVGHLLGRHVDPEVTLEIALAINDARCRPPLPGNEVVAIVDSIAGLELKKRINA
jgi:Bifunctional DNA primase/polymerase, N-terminal/Primase C terminal 1 (PriCT-1)